MKGSLLVSVIVTVHNTEKYVSRCLKSILCQTYKNIEVIVIDDGSTDSSTSICESFATKDERIRFFRKENGGVSSARNVGLQNCCGEYIFFVDSDDELLPSCVETCVGIALRTDADIVKFALSKKYGFIRKKYSFSCDVDCLIQRHEFSKKVFPFLYSTFDFNSVCTMCIKASLAKKNSFERYKLGEDYLYLVKSILQSRRIYVCSKVLYIYRLNSGSATHHFDGPDAMSKFMDNIEVYDSVGHLLGFSKKVIKNRLVAIFKSFAVFLVLNCDSDEFDGYLEKMNEVVASKYGFTCADCGDWCNYRKLRRKTFLRRLFRGMLPG